MSLICTVQVTVTTPDGMPIVLTERVRLVPLNNGDDDDQWTEDLVEVGMVVDQLVSEVRQDAGDQVAAYVRRAQERKTSE